MQCNGFTSASLARRFEVLFRLERLLLNGSKSLLILLAGFHSNQACQKSYKSWLFVLAQGQRQG